MKKKISDRDKPLDKLAIKTLFGAADSAAKENKGKNFIKELLTESEQLMLGRRLLIAQMLLSGRSQAEIIYDLKLSPNTVIKVKRWLIDEFPEYGKAVKLEKEKRAKNNLTKEYNEGQEHYSQLTFASLKKKHPMHFLLFNLSDKIFKK